MNLSTPIKAIARRAANLATLARLSASETAMTAAAKKVEYLLDETYNDDWDRSNRGSRVSFVRHPVLYEDSKVFTMGSCFAREIRHVLQARDFDLYPKYNLMSFDESVQNFRKWASLGHTNHYNTFTIRQEFENAFHQKYYPRDGMVHVSSQKNERRSWQDPFRNRVYAASQDAIVALSQSITDCISDGIRQSDVYVITLGLTEVWRSDRTGLYANQTPANETAGGCPGFTFECSSYQQNYENMRAVCSLLLKHYPERKLLLTVSPVALRKTYSRNDVVVANMESKSVLRAVAAEISREFSNVVYWPSFEIAMSNGIFEEDGRHVTRQGVEAIMKQFVEVHLQRNADKPREAVRASA